MVAGGGNMSARKWNASYSLEETTRAVPTITKLNSRIADAVDRQNEMTKAVNVSIGNISEVAVRTSNGPDHTATASGELARLSADWQSLVQQFKV